MMNILMSANNEVIDGVELVLYTLLTHNKNCRIYIFTMDIECIISDEGEVKKYVGLDTVLQKYLTNLVHYLDNTSDIKFVDCHDVYVEHLLGNPNEIFAKWLTPYASLRLFADIMLPNVHNILYLDCDVAICGNIEEMYYNCCAQNCDYAAYVCDDARYGEGEMISGVMVLNLDHIRKSGFLASARRNAKNNAYQWYDQDAIRETGVKPYHISEQYAYMHDLNNLVELPKIIHFTNELSPKVYMKDVTKEYFYRKYSFLNYVKEGTERFKTIVQFKK